PRLRPRPWRRRLRPRPWRRPPRLRPWRRPPRPRPLRRAPRCSTPRWCRWSTLRRCSPTPRRC
ncbi:hypothetical protein E8A74_50855, partial [Polyangium fumosum]